MRQMVLKPHGAGQVRRLLSSAMEPEEVLAHLEPMGSPSELLGHFSAPRSDRAETIQRYWSQPCDRDLAENLISLEIDDHARSVVISLLRARDDLVEL